MEIKHLIKESEILKVKAEKLKAGDYFKPICSESVKDVFETISYSIEDRGWIVRNVNTKQPSILLKTQEVVPLTLTKIHAGDKVVYMYYYPSFVS